MPLLNGSFDRTKFFRIFIIIQEKLRYDVYIKLRQLIMDVNGFAQISREINMFIKEKGNCDE